MTLLGQKIGHYRIISLVGKGVCGAVYVAFDEVRKREGAVKVLHPEVASLPGLPERLRRIASALGSSSHPALLRPTEVLQTPQHVAVAMERVAGKSLGLLMEELGAPLDPQQALPLFREVLGAVIHAHQGGVICGNIRPANVLICASDSGSQVRLSDVGVYPIGADGQMAHLSDDRKLEYLRFAAPEVIDGKTPTEVQADVFALGATLYQMVTGWPPRIALELDRLLAASRQVIQAPHKLRPDLPKELERTLLTATAVDPDLRYSSAQGLLDALASLEGSPEVARALPTSMPPLVAGEPMVSGLQPHDTIRESGPPGSFETDGTPHARDVVPPSTAGAGVNRPVMADGPTVAMDVVGAEPEMHGAGKDRPRVLQVPVKPPVKARVFDIEPVRPSLVRGELQIKPSPARMRTGERDTVLAERPGQDPQRVASVRTRAGAGGEPVPDLGPATKGGARGSSRPAGGGLLVKVGGMIIVAAATAIAVLWLGGVFSSRRPGSAARDEKQIHRSAPAADGSAAEVSARPTGSVSERETDGGTPVGGPSRVARADAAVGIGAPPERRLRPTAGRGGPMGGRARIAAISVSGRGVSPAAFRKAVGRRLGSAAACYRRLLRKRPSSRGVVQLELVIHRNGAVANVLVTGSTLGDDQTERCIQDGIRRMKVHGVTDVATAAMRIALSP